MIKNPKNIIFLILKPTTRTCRQISLICLRHELVIYGVSMWTYTVNAWLLTIHYSFISMYIYGLSMSICFWHKQHIECHMLWVYSHKWSWLVLYCCHSCLMFSSKKVLIEKVLVDIYSKFYSRPWLLACFKLVLLLNMSGMSLEYTVNHNES